MLQITNQKVETLKPTWARFVGFSLLFDNPSNSLNREGGRETINCEFEANTDLLLCRALSQTIREVGECQQGLCLLPPTSYHVTFFDCGNQANAVGANPTSKASLTELIEGLPESWREQDELVTPAVELAARLGNSLDMGFRYSRLKNWDNQVIVAALEPSDERSKATLEHLVAERAKLSNTYRTTHGFGAGPNYTPHISLAYFANRESGEAALEKHDEWDTELRTRTERLEIRFNSISTYAFTDMATFFRESRPPR